MLRFCKLHPRLWRLLLAILVSGGIGYTASIGHPLLQTDAQGEMLNTTPYLSPTPGYYKEDIQVKIHLPDTSGKLIFTTDGSLPTQEQGTPYTAPILLRASPPQVIILRTRAILPDGQLGPVTSATYFMGIDATLPLVSLIMDPGDLWAPQRGIYTNPKEKGVTWERPVDVTYLDEDHSTGFQIAAGIRIHGGRSREFDKKSLRLYFRGVYGVGQLQYPLFTNSAVQSFESLILHAGGQDTIAPERENWTLLRNRLVDSLALELQGYATRSRPVLLFINGKPWGIYYLRERLDDRLLANHHGVETADFLDSPEHVWVRTTQSGDRENWDHLIAYLETHDLKAPQAYAYIQSQVDIANFIDYNLLQIYIANVDWPFHNVQQFRPRVQGGRWHWLFWDSDHSFAAAPDGSVDSNLMTLALQDDYPQTGGRDTLLLRRLLENPDFRVRFLNRAADLINTNLTPESVIAHIDLLAGEIAPDISYETLRWGNETDWETNVEGLRDFARRRPAFFTQHLVEALDLDGTVPLTLTAPAAGTGSIAVNGTLIETIPWHGTYFQGVPIQVTAAPAAGFRFAGWEDPALLDSPTLALTPTAGTILTPRFEPLAPDAPHPGDIVFTNLHREPGERWVELQVQRSGGIDLRGWRITDNDTKTATDEGSLIFPDLPTFSTLPQGTRIQIILESNAPIPDLLDLPMRRVVLHTTNGLIDTTTDPGFIIGKPEALVLLAPGATEDFADDQGIAFFSETDAVTPASFGVLSDGVKGQ